MPQSSECRCLTYGTWSMSSLSANGLFGAYLRLQSLHDSIFSSGIYPFRIRSPLVIGPYRDAFVGHLVSCSLDAPWSNLWLGSDLVPQCSNSHVGVPWKVGVSCGAGSEAPALGELDEVEPDGPGVDERLPEPKPGSDAVEDELPML